MSSKTVKVSGLTKTALPINPSDMISISTTGQNGFDSYAMSVDDLQKVIAKENSFLSISDAVAASKVGDIFYVYTDTSQHFVYGYVNRNLSSEQIMDASGKAKVFITSNYFSQLATNYGYSLINEVASFNDLRNLPVVTEGQKVKLRSWIKGGTKGGGEFIGHLGIVADDGGLCASGNGFYWQRVNDGAITPEMFGCVGDGVTDDSTGLQNIAYVLQTVQTIYSVYGPGNYALGKQVVFANLGGSMNFYLRAMCPTASWPIPTDWKLADSLISVGNTGGSMVSLNFRCDYVNGGGVADWLHITGKGAGGSYFHAQRLTNCVNGVRSIGISWPTASNTISGGYWDASSGIAVWLERTVSADSGVLEGWILDINFIAEFKICAILLRNGAQYTNVVGQSDFNGRWSTVVTYTTASTGLPTRNDTYTNTAGKKAELISYYSQTSTTNSFLLYEGFDVSATGSQFAVGDTLTSSDGTFVATITSVRQPGAGNWFPDVVFDFAGSAFAKCFVKSPYCGGVIGHSLYSSVVVYNNSANGASHSYNGAQFINSGTVLSIFDDYKNQYVFDFYAKFIAPYQHIYMRNNRLYGIEIGMTLQSAVVTQARIFTYIGDSTVAGLNEVYEVTLAGPTGLYGKWTIYVDAVGAYLYPDLSVSNYVTLSIDSSNKFKVNAAQSVQSSALVVFNYQRII